MIGQSAHLLFISLWEISLAENLATVGNALSNQSLLTSNFAKVASMEGENKTPNYRTIISFEAWNVYQFEFMDTHF